ncbi:HNH endonuclease [Hymenobacter chitinivorans]|uniref:Putative restriction endonuclease n=1 Tax=Hymenobacter chitinivorans DSM 11115 TaxID=1121954 RepID=A0A2M9AS64_9BACT|nr:HNH endonuclease [Hymenobacter chitinivorans]PJJ48536.1 putative restriction endonuclease [Hymenobacter chitinivorans DSM 11115]
MTDLPHYLTRFRKLKTSKLAGEEAPYKPALLLAVLEGLEDGSVQANQIVITPELLAAFQSNCRDLSTSGRFRANNFALPFYHLTGDGFWHLRTHFGQPLVLTSSGSPRSLGHLRQVVAYASFDEPLWLLLQDRATRHVFRDALLDRYFPQTRLRYRPTAGPEALRVLGQQMLQEPAAVYQTHINLADEVETAVRSAVFKREVLKAYNFTCAISGLQLISTSTTAPAPLLDACHIVPWAISHDDTIGNGLALTPTLHRAFDRHLLRIDQDYRVRVASSFRELRGAEHGLLQFEGQKLRLPERREWWPRKEGFGVGAGRY